MARYLIDRPMVVMSIVLLGACGSAFLGLHSFIAYGVGVFAGFISMMALFAWSVTNGVSADIFVELGQLASAARANRNEPADAKPDSSSMERL